MTDDMKVFGLHASRAFGQKVADHLGVELSAHEERAFDEGEHKTRPLVNVRGADVFVIQSLYSGPDESVNDKLCRLLFFAGALRDAAASRVTVMTPYLCYARKDRKTQTRDPVTTRYVASLFKAVGVDRVVTIDVHNLAAYQNAFRCRTEHLEARSLFARHLAKTCANDDLVILSPDVGGMKRAETFRRSLENMIDRPVDIGFMEKRRALGEVSGERLYAEVDGKTVVMIDDIIGSGTTMERAAQACLEAGAQQVFAAATHGLFVGRAGEVIGGNALTKTLVTDSVPPFRLNAATVKAKVTVLTAAPLFGDAIRAIHENGSIVELLAD
ncbi:MAG: ribose-phosphate pyrophosphokinase [Alphaproteobacteria bacterium]|nr:ribose-phosphate pyrophosphokinase [Alphaproteobacteria bacterium]